MGTQVWAGGKALHDAASLWALWAGAVACDKAGAVLQECTTRTCFAQVSAGAGPRCRCCLFPPHHCIVEEAGNWPAQQVEPNCVLDNFAS